MTVEELREILDCVDDDLIISLTDGKGGFLDVKKVCQKGGRLYIEEEVD